MPPPPPLRPPAGRAHRPRGEDEGAEEAGIWSQGTAGGAEDGHRGRGAVPGQGQPGKERAPFAAGADGAGGPAARAAAGAAADGDRGQRAWCDGRLPAPHVAAHAAGAHGLVEPARRRLVQPRGQSGAAQGKPRARPARVAGHGGEARRGAEAQDGARDARGGRARPRRPRGAAPGDDGQGGSRGAGLLARLHAAQGGQGRQGQGQGKGEGKEEVARRAAQQYQQQQQQQDRVQAANIRPRRGSCGSATGGGAPPLVIYKCSAFLLVSPKVCKKGTSSCATSVPVPDSSARQRAHACGAWAVEGNHDMHRRCIQVGVFPTSALRGVGVVPTRLMAVPART
eukprot:355490-Chlamydomonas_euryale.AAC.13